MGKIYKLKLLLLFLSIGYFSNCQVVFPLNFPKELINKVVCEQRKFYDKLVYNKNFGGREEAINFELNISSDEGLYVVIKNDKGDVYTQRVKKFPVYYSKIEPTYDNYGDLMYNTKIVSYKIYTDKGYDTEFCIDCIKSIKYEDKIGDEYEGMFIIEIVVSRGDPLLIKPQVFELYLSERSIKNVCKEISSKAEILKKQKEINNVQNMFISNIKDFILKKDYKNALSIYNQLNIPQPDLLEQIEQIETDKQNEVKNLFMTNQGDLAYEKSQLLYKESDEIQNLVIEYFTKRNSAYILTLEKEKALQIIKTNFLNNILTLKDGKYRLYITQNQKAIIVDGKKELFSSFIEMKNMATIKVNNLDIPVNSEYNFEVTSSSINLSIYDYTQTLEFDKERNPNVVYLNSLYLNKQEIPQGKYWKMQGIQNNKNIDGVTLSSLESKKFISEHKLKKDHTGAIYYVIIIGLGLLYVLAALPK